MSKIINTDQSMPIPLEVGDKFHLNNERLHPIGEIKPEGKIIVFSHNQFENGTAKNAKIAPAQQSIAPGDWLDTFVTTEPFEWKALVNGVYILAHKTLNGRYVVEKIREFTKGQTVRGFLPPREKVVVAVAATPAPEQHKHDAKKPNRPLQKSLNASGESSVDPDMAKLIEEVYKKSKQAIDDANKKHREDQLRAIDAELEKKRHERITILEAESKTLENENKRALKRNRELTEENQALEETNKTLKNENRKLKLSKIDPDEVARRVAARYQAEFSNQP